MDNRLFYDVENDKNLLMNYRFVQPPQIAYFVTTQDEYGNINSTPVTLGTCNSANLPRDNRLSEFYFTFSLGKIAVTDEGNYIHPRDGYINLLKSDECVISYIGANMMRESIIANMPLPRGISELEVAGLSTFPSKNISVPGLKECPVNIECKIINHMSLGETYELFVAKVVGVSVSSTLVEKDTEGLGVALIDPLFEINITKTKNDNIRLNYGQLDLNKITVTEDDFGSFGDWVGSFSHWISSEVKRGKINEAEKDEILKLRKLWLENRNPKENHEVKRVLTESLKRLVRR